MISEPARSCPDEPALLRRVETELTAESSAATAERSCVAAAGTRPAAAFEDVRVIHVGAVDEIAASGYDLVERTMCRSDFLRARGDDHRLGHDMLPRDSAGWTGRPRRALRSRALRPVRPLSTRVALR